MILLRVYDVFFVRDVNICLALDLFCVGFVLY